MLRINKKFSYYMLKTHMIYAIIRLGILRPLYFFILRPGKPV